MGIKRRYASSYDKNTNSWGILDTTVNSLVDVTGSSIQAANLIDTLNDPTTGFGSQQTPRFIIPIPRWDDE